jgi:hypothetical protein
MLYWEQKHFGQRGVFVGRARRVADGGSPSGVVTVDDKRRLRVRLVIDHVSPRRTAAEGCERRGADGYPTYDSSSLECSASSAVEVERFREVGLSPSAHLGMTADWISALKCRASSGRPAGAASADRFLLAARPVARENDGHKQGVAHGRSCDNISCITPPPPRLRAAKV